MGDRGRLVIPAEMRRLSGMHKGDALVLVPTDGGVVVLTRSRAEQLVREQLDGPSLVDELLAERRRSASAGE